MRWSFACHPAADRQVGAARALGPELGQWAMDLCRSAGRLVSELTVRAISRFRAFGRARVGRSRVGSDSLAPGTRLQF